MDQIYKGTEEDRMEPYYYSKMNKVQQAAYHAIRQGLLEISDSIQIPGMEAEELYNVFFRLRLDHPEMSLADLGRELSEPLSRSGVNHRFQRIAAEADMIRDQISKAQ